MSNYHNGLVPVPSSAPLYEYQRLAHAGLLFFMDDHQVVLHIQPHPDPTKDGYLALVYDRNVRRASSTTFKHLGRAFLTAPQNIQSAFLTEHESTSLTFLRDRLGLIIPVGPAPDSLTDEELEPFERFVEQSIPTLARSFKQ